MGSSRRLLWLGVVLAAGAGAGAAAACSPSAKQLPPDDFVLPTYDGATLALTEDAGAQPTRVLATGFGGPEAKVTVVFQDATGAIVDTVFTDALGRAARTAPAGGQVTVLFGTASSPAAVTYVDVQPGDLLVALDPTSTASNYFDTQVVALPALPAQLAEAGTVGSYTAFAGTCQGYFGGVPFDIYLDEIKCVNLSGEYPLLVTAEGQNGELAYTYQHGNGIAGDGGTSTLSLGGSWSTTFGTWTTTATNIASTAYGLVGFYSEGADGILTATSSNAATPIEGEPVPFTYVTHPGFPEFAQTEVGFFDGYYGAYTAVATRSAAPAPDGSSTIDMAGALPLVTNVTPDFTTDATHPNVSWTYASGTGGSAGQLVTIQWQEFDSDADVYVSKQWTFVVPPNVLTVKAPSLPPANAAWGPGVVTGWNTPQFYSTDTTTGLGVDDFRRLAASLPFANWNYISYNQPFIPPLPTDGATLRLTTYGPSFD